MRINRTEFLTILDTVTSALTAKDSVDQSSCFCFTGDGRLRTFNGETYCETPCPLDLRGAVFAGYPSGDGLLEALRRLPDEDVDVEEKKNRLIIRGKNDRIGVGREPEILSPYDRIEQPHKDDWRPLHEDFGPAVSLVAPCSGKNAKTNPMGECAECIHLTTDYVEAADNVRFARYDVPLPLRNVCIYTKAMKQIPRLGMTKIAETHQWIFFQNPAGVVLGALKVLIDYPNIGVVFDKKGVQTAIPKILAVAADNAGHFSQGDDIAIRFRDNQLIVRGEGDNSWYKHQKGIVYDGPNFGFRVSPVALVELAKAHSQAEVIETMADGPDGKPIKTGCLKVEGGKWRFLTALDVDNTVED